MDGDSDEDLLHFVNEQENVSTRRKTDSDVNLLKQFLCEVRHVDEEFDTLSVRDLDRYITSFIVNIRRKDGKEYEPTTLRCFVSSFDRYLRQHDYPYTLAESRGSSLVQEISWKPSRWGFQIVAHHYWKAELNLCCCLTTIMSNGRMNENLSNDVWCWATTT